MESPKPPRGKTRSRSHRVKIGPPKRAKRKGAEPTPESKRSLWFKENVRPRTLADETDNG